VRDLKDYLAEYDGPPLNITAGAHLAGVVDPEDNPWHRLTELAKHCVICVCGAPLPRMQQWTFTLKDNSQVDYTISQCARCGKVYWTQP